MFHILICNILIKYFLGFLSVYIDVKFSEWVLIIMIVIYSGDIIYSGDNNRPLQTIRRLWVMFISIPLES